MILKYGSLALILSRLKWVAHIRKATRAEPEQMAIYRALKVNPAPGGISKTIV